MEVPMRDLILQCAGAAAIVVAFIHGEQEGRCASQPAKPCAFPSVDRGETLPHWAAGNRRSGYMTLVLVTGGTGHLGQDLVDRLVRDGHEVRVFARSRRPRRDVEWAI